MLRFNAAIRSTCDTWLRWWDLQGNLLLTGSERALLAEERAESAEGRARLAEERAESAEVRAAKLAERLRELGVDPNAL